MNRQGFTLIELLATIVIMSLILLLVVPSITALVNNNENKSYEYYGDSLVEAAKVYVTKEGEDINPIGDRNWIGCVDITYQDLVVANLIKPISLENIDCSNATIRYTKTKNSSSYNYNLTCIDTTTNDIVYEYKDISDGECSVADANDKTPPICGSISGASTTWTNADREITVNCSDDYSGCQSVKKTYNTTTITDNIDIIDGNGNKNSCPINVYVDKTAPTCGTITTGEATNNQKRTVTVACNDNHSGCKENIYSTTISSTKKNTTITIEDKAGNKKNCDIEIEVAEEKNGWEIEDNCWVYYKNNNKVTGWQYIDGSWYYLKFDGCMQTGWLHETETYPSCTSGWWYFNSSGAMQTGWQYIDGFWYYLAKGNSTEGKWSGSRPTGCMYTGWVYSEDYACETHGWYFNSSGQMLSNTSVDGYTLNSSGCWITAGTNNCNIRGNRLLTGLFPWVCTSGHTHTTGYAHYCSNSSGNILSYNDNPSLVGHKYICPTMPFDASTGWTVIND